MRAVKSPDVIHLCEIMILGRQPEHGNGGNAAVRHFARDARRGDGFVDGVRRSGKQADLLTRDDRDRAWLREPAQGVVFPILADQRAHHRRAAIVRINHLCRRGPQRIRMVWIMPVKASDAIEMIGEIGEQPGGPGELGMSDTGRVHERSGWNSPKMDERSKVNRCRWAGGSSKEKRREKAVRGKNAAWKVPRDKLS